MKYKALKDRKKKGKHLAKRQSKNNKKINMPKRTNTNRYELEKEDLKVEEEARYECGVCEFECLNRTEFQVWHFCGKEIKISGDQTLVTHRAKKTYIIPNAFVYIHL